MIQPKKIIVEIDENGNCSINGKGFIGTECAKFISEIESNLGKKISQTNKPEYRMKRTTINRNLQKRMG